MKPLLRRLGVWALLLIFLIIAILFVTLQKRYVASKKLISPLPAQIKRIPSPTPSFTLTPSPYPTSSPTLEPTEIPEPSPTSTPQPPTQTPTPTAIPPSAEQLDKWFTDYSNHYSVDRQKLWSIAVCESELKPEAINGDYGGLFQFSSSTWQTTRATMNMDSNPELRFNPEEAIRTAAFKISTDGLSPWKNCAK